MATNLNLDPLKFDTEQPESAYSVKVVSVSGGYSSSSSASAGNAGHAPATPVAAVVWAGSGVASLAIPTKAIPFDSAAANRTYDGTRPGMDTGTTITRLADPSETPLHLAAWNGSVKEVHALLAAGADPSARCDGEDTPLHLAIQSHSFELAKALLAAGADPFAKNRDGSLPDDSLVDRWGECWDEELRESFAVRRLALSEERALLDCMAPAKASDPGRAAL